VISFFKDLFSGTSEDTDVDEDKLDSVKNKMTIRLSDTKTPSLDYPRGFDANKPTIVILDDSSGATLLFDDNIKELQAEGGLAAELQFLKVSTPQAVFMLRGELDKGRLNNIVGAVLDITIGGYAIVDGHTVILDGIDAHKIISDRFPKAAMRFFTSHSMNEKNAEIYRFMKKYEEYAGESIVEKTYMKNPFTTNRIDMLRDILGEINDVKS